MNQNILGSQYSLFETDRCRMPTDLKFDKTETELKPLTTIIGNSFSVLQKMEKKEGCVIIDVEI